MEFEEDIEMFKKEVCSNCKNKECSKGIHVIKHDNMIVTKCCNYIRNDDKSTDEQTKEVIKYYHERNKKYEKMD